MKHGLSGGSQAVPVASVDSAGSCGAEMVLWTLSCMEPVTDLYAPASVSHWLPWKDLALD